MNTNKLTDRAMIDETRGALIDAINRHVVSEVVYSGRYGKIEIQATHLDGRPSDMGRPTVFFVATLPDGKSRKVAILREALGFLRVPYEDGTLPLSPENP